MSSVDSLRVSLETEVKDKAEALYLKKKLESEVQQLQATIHRAREANNDLQKAKERAEKETEEQQARIEESEHIISQQREQLNTVERRIASLMGELEEAHTLLEQADRSRRSADVNLTDANDYIRKLTAENENLLSAKERLDEELQCMQVGYNAGDTPPHRGQYSTPELDTIIIHFLEIALPFSPRFRMIIQIFILKDTVSLSYHCRMSLKT